MNRVVIFIVFLCVYFISTYVDLCHAFEPIMASFIILVSVGYLIIALIVKNKRRYFTIGFILLIAATLNIITAILANKLINTEANYIIKYIESYKEKYNNYPGNIDNVVHKYMYINHSSNKMLFARYTYVHNKSNYPIFSYQYYPLQWVYYDFDKRVKNKMLTD